MLINFSRILVLPILCLAFSGCSPTNSILDAQVDTKLTTSSTAKRAGLPARYFGAMCLRAGLPVYQDAASAHYCDIDLIKWQGWRTVVAAALNDIDERCDAYLYSIDQARRDRAYNRRKFTTISNTTNIVLSAAEAGTRALGIVEEAFSYVTGSIETYYSRLILETDKSAIETLVRKLRNAYRHKLLSVTADKAYGFPGSYYIVKGYIRLCLPQTIEAEINSTVDRVQYTDDDRTSVGEIKNPLLATLEAIPGLTDERSSGSGNGERRPNRPGGGTDTGNGFISNPIGPVEERIEREDGRTIQSNICAGSIDGDFGRGGSETRQAIAGAKAGLRLRLKISNRNIEAGKYSSSNNIQSQDELDAFLRDGEHCTAPYRSAFEKYFLPTPATIRKFHQDLSAAIKTITTSRGKNGKRIVVDREDDAVKAPALASQTTITSLTRKAIGYIRISNLTYPIGRQPNPTANFILQESDVNLVRDYSNPF